MCSLELYGSCRGISFFSMIDLLTGKSTCALLADRHTVFVEGIRNLLKTEFEIVFVVNDTRSLLEGAMRLDPAVIVVDLSLSDTGPIELISDVRSIAPRTRLVVLTIHDQCDTARSVLAAGASAVVLKRSVAQDLMEAVDAVSRGENYLSAEIGQ